MSRSTERFVWSVFGLTGTGKTYLVEQFLGAYPRPILIPDTMGEWTRYGATYENPEGMLRDVVAAITGEMGFPPGGIYVLKPYDVETVNEFFGLAHQWRVPGTYICDEFHQYAPSGKTTPFLSMIRMGRHASQSIIGITQRPQGVHNHAVEESGIACFQVSGRAAQYLTDSKTGYMPEKLGTIRLKSIGDRKYILGGPRIEQIPFRESLGDPDGSVWMYNAEEHVTERVHQPPPE